MAHRMAFAKAYAHRGVQDRYLRSVADFQNLQSRTAREVAAARDYAVTGFAKDLLESVDNLDRALSTVPEAQLQPVAREDGTASEGREAPAPNAALIDLYNGLKMTEKVLLQTFARHGLERYAPAGEVCNHEYHEASFASAMPGKKEGSVFSVLQRGYTLNGRVIRVSVHEPLLAVYANVRRRQRSESLETRERTAACRLGHSLC